MKPISGAMLVLAALLTSPALAAAATGSMPLDVALVRYLVVAGLCWVLLTLASEWLWSEPAPVAEPSVPGATGGASASGDTGPDGS